MDSEIRDMSDLADLLDPPGFRDPSKPHVTDLIHAIENLGKYVEPFDYGALPQHVKNIMAMGRIWEHLVRADVVREAVKCDLIPVMKLTPEEDGIIGSLDGALYAPTSPTNKWDAVLLSTAEVVVEIKARFSPPNVTFPRNNPRYMRQCKAYCYMTGARKVWMPILYLSTKPPNAEYLIHRFEFSDLEVQENWRAIVNMKHYLEKTNGSS